MVDIIFELSFIDDMVNLLAYALHSPVISQLADDELIELTLSELHVLVNGLLALLNDVFQPQRPKLHPLILDDPQGNTRRTFFQGTRVACKHLLLLLLVERVVSFPIELSLDV